MPAEIPMPADGYTGRQCAASGCTLTAFVGYEFCPRCLVRQAPDDAHNVGVVDPLTDDEDTQPGPVQMPERVRTNHEPLWLTCERRTDE